MNARPSRLFENILGLGLSAALLLSLVLSEPSFAWGTLGHRLSTEIATVLLEKESPQGWGRFLARHRFEMGIYSMYPDADFKHGSVGVQEGPTHFLDLDLLLTPGQDHQHQREQVIGFVENYSDLAKSFAGKFTQEDFIKVGSSPWRQEQFRLNVLDLLKEVQVIEGTYQRGATSTGTQKALFQVLYYLGLLSHYSADAAMPYHALSDWNGWKTGHGGIHFYYENDCVFALEPHLSGWVLDLALAKREEWLKGWLKGVENPNPKKLMGLFLLESLGEVKKVEEIDAKHVRLAVSDAEKKIFAKRKDPIQGCRHFKKHIIERLAKGAVVTAWIWKQTLPESVRFNFTPEKTLQFSDWLHEPPFLAPDYLPK